MKEKKDGKQFDVNQFIQDPMAFFNNEERLEGLRLNIEKRKEKLNSEVTQKVLEIYNDITSSVGDLDSECPSDIDVKTGFAMDLYYCFPDFEDELREILHDNTPYLWEIIEVISGKELSS
ncbi:hypothetical protein [uncultured Aquimarina sp.]|uniref:hypothetical protein n=1 Tax=uncultured Aquimarina sp. TaxID=575652 RepID=UPI00260D011B|nr:hypothetical protein [uncultured Aquimarina sp.]